jgi:uncharacterized protein
MVEFSGIEINLVLLVLFCLVTGLISGVTGVGGAFILTPALIMLGIPAHQAVGTVLAWVSANALLVLLMHRRQGNVDLKLGITVAVATMLGIEIGVRLLNSVTDPAAANRWVLGMLLALLCTVSLYMLTEFFRRKRALDHALLKDGSLPPAMPVTAVANRLQRIYLPPIMHFSHSGIRLSVWLLIPSGILIGVLAGFTGSGGGFITVPVLVYLFGVQPLTAVGTALVQVALAAGYGALRHGLAGNVVLPFFLIMLAASFIGAQFGSHVTRYLRGIGIRLLLALTTLVAAIGILAKVIQTGGTLAALLMLAGLILVALLTGTLYYYGRRYRRGVPVPRWVSPLIAHDLAASEPENRTR